MRIVNVAAAQMGPIQKADSREALEVLASKKAMRSRWRRFIYWHTICTLMGSVSPAIGQ
ncbi:hypothetical protein [Bradyrhizobium genosp. A]|uniref:hypothetical protein n=1 Tax=Bradyrhizobium genosp. A TaxID=83626 RepID=UPI003CE69736